jgi:hypothetical protein
MLLLPDGDKSASSERCLRKGAYSLNGDWTGFHRKPDYVLDLSREAMLRILIDYSLDVSHDFG